MLKLGNYEFDVESASFSAHFADAALSKRMQYEEKPRFTWSIELEFCEGEIPYGSNIEDEFGEDVLSNAEDELDEFEDDEFEDEFDDDEPWTEYVYPRLYHNNGFKLNVHSWKMLEGIKKVWESEYNEAGEEAGTLYVLEHEAVTSGTIEFLKRKDDTFTIRWSGTANVNWSEELGEDVPFVFEGDLKFGGVYASADNINSLEELKLALSEFVDLDEYELISENCFQIQNGINRRWRFQPKI